MKKTAIAIAAMVAMTAALGARAEEQAGAPAVGKPQTTCPVMGSRVTSSSRYVDVNGKRIYVCCGMCVAKVKADPEKYIKKLEAEGVAVAKTQTACPVMGKPVNSSSRHVDADGKRIYVCCGMCEAKVKADPEKYIKQLETQGVALDPAK